MLTTMNLLMVHGNGGTGTRFQIFRDLVADRGPEELRLHLPELPGFDGRPLPTWERPGWEPFLAALSDGVQTRPEEPWVFYGHGIGGSLLLEWASRDWESARGRRVRPGRVILHGSIGASLEHRWFPKLMRPPFVRSLVQWLIVQPGLQRSWERKLFTNPGGIPADLRHRFFTDYRSCAAFPVFFDLITPDWYRQVQEQTRSYPFYFLWGDQERVVASRHLDFWRRDFPAATFEVVGGWDHFPMLDQPEAFYHKILELTEGVVYE